MIILTKHIFHKQLIFHRNILFENVIKIFIRNFTNKNYYFHNYTNIFSKYYYAYLKRILN